jgi:hypothetical protein
VVSRRVQQGTDVKFFFFFFFFVERKVYRVDTRKPNVPSCRKHSVQSMLRSVNGGTATQKPHHHHQHHYRNEQQVQRRMSLSPV